LSYVIAKEGEGKQLDVVKVICQKCEGFEYVSLDKAKGINDENFKCTVCNNQKLVKSYVKCASCGQTMNPISMTCWCPQQDKPLLTWYSKDPTNKRLNEQIEDGKIRTLERKIVRNAKQEEFDRKIRVDKNLIELNKNIKQLVNVLGEKNVQKKE